MIASRLLKKQLNLLAGDRPTRNMKGCINRAQVKHPCTVCKDICPKGVYSGNMGQNADFSACINCNLCVSACPARCIAPSMQNAVAYLHLLDLQDEQIVISANGEFEKSHLQVPSLAVLPWEYLACLGFEHQVILLMGSQTQEETELLENALVRLAFFFGMETYQQHFRLTASAQDIPPLLIDRRDIFRKAKEAMKRRVAPLASGDGTVDGLLYRSLLAERMKQDTSGKSFGFPVPMVTQACTGCGVCGILCPQKAIRVQNEKNQFSIVLDTLRCNGCELCTKICIHSAIPGMGAAYLNSMAQARLLHKETKE